MGSIENISELCRLCLVKDQVNVPIFEENATKEQTFVKINSCLPVKVSRDDSLPKKICDGCSCKLDMLYTFRNTSVDSEKQLLKWLNQAGLSCSQSAVKDPLASTKPEVTIKQETFEPTDSRDDLGLDTHSYIMQQQKLPYSQEFEFGEPSESNVGLMTDEPAPKKAKRAAALNKASVETDEDDLDAAMQITKAEDEDSDEIDQPEYVEAPSTSADDQPGPSGVNKTTVEAPSDDFVKTEASAKSSKDKNVCKICNLKFDAYKTLRKHRKDVHTFKTLSCPVCLKLFKDQWNLNKHVETHSETKKYHCEECEEPLKTYQQLQEHRRRHKNPSGLVCPECKKVFASRSSFRKHCLIHKGIRHKCEECKKTFSDPSSLRVHKKTHEENFVAPKFSCDKCDKVYTVEYNLKNHIASCHDGERKWHICETCGRQMSSKKSLRDHQMIHNDERPFACDKCDKSFRKREHLVDHDRTHTKEKPYVCEFCSKAFTTRKNLKVHITIYHEGKRHLCELCGKEMASVTSLNNHMKTHTGEKPFACNYCGKRFTKKYHLSVHINVHTKEKPYACTFCDKKYTQGTSLSLHIRAVHSGERPYTCDICAKGFITKTLLRMHRISHWTRPDV
ncbi:gastrula zinc finger protein XlCGF26.1 isoform X4 [Tribolium castaneum]|uniref:gastrula zinc finger protein XlCGF26.1 isoform X4 n=1 Tax=Tribolium castaneum TaxID=7070 RepID=UPI00077DE89C|nr:PREDICTED: gastrula zinc finger protein XlCGF26.1 isoform X4 [Tribolium castaneum]|eukprot:XP_015834118.1 PREDICTED: gastrula zinc finger protein XlCGF26.1 isoform X4 [Tribolium castaneum]